MDIKKSSGDISIADMFKLAVEKDNQVFTIVIGRGIQYKALKYVIDFYKDSINISKTVKQFNKTNRLLEFNNGSIIEFNNYQVEQDAKSGVRDYLFIDETSGISQDIFNQLAIRTRCEIYNLKKA